MSRVSDEDVERIYDSFKTYTLDRLRDDENPNLAPCAFNEMAPPSLSHIIIKLTGLQRVNYRRMERILSKFPDGGAELQQDESVTGKANYWVEIPIPRKSRHKKGKHKSRHVSHVIDHSKPSCTRLLALVVVLLAMVVIAGLSSME